MQSEESLHQYKKRKDQYNLPPYRPPNADNVMVFENPVALYSSVLPTYSSSSSDVANSTAALATLNGTFATSRVVSTVVPTTVLTIQDEYNVADKKIQTK